MPNKRTPKPITKSKHTRSAAPKRRTGRVLHPEVEPKQSRIPLLLIACGLSLMAVFMMHRVVYQHTLALSRDTVKQLQVKEPIKRILPTHIYIQWFIDTDIESLTWVGDWPVSEHTATFLANSAAPGEGGNSIIYGHNKREIIGNIRALKGSEKITLTTSDGVKRLYQVKSLKEVDPSDTSALQPTKTETLTLYTCSGIFDSKRFIVQAVPIQK